MYNTLNGCAYRTQYSLPEAVVRVVVARLVVVQEVAALVRSVLRYLLARCHSMFYLL